MEEIRSIRRNQVRAAERYQSVQKTEKQTESTPVKQAVPREAASVTLNQLMNHITQAESQVQEARQSLQTNEAALAEVEDGLDQMDNLAQEAAGEDAPDRAALQGEWEQLREELVRILGGGAMAAGMFSMEEGAGQNGISDLPAWLLWGMADSPDPAQLLEALGIDANASGPELLAALVALPLESDPAAGYLAAVYLGTVIASGDTGSLDETQAAQGLLRLLDAISNGGSPDKAIEDLTDGLFTSLEDFQQQFMEGSAPGMESLFTSLLLNADFSLPDLIALLAGGDGGKVDLLLTLLTALESAENLLPELGAGDTPDPVSDLQNEASQPALQAESRELGGATIEGRGDVTYDDVSRTLTLDGNESVSLQGAGQEAPALRLTGRGEVELRQVGTPRLTVETPQSQVRVHGEATLGEIRLWAKAVLTLAGDGLVHIGDVKGESQNILRLKEGAFILAHQGTEVPVRLVADGPVILQAARESHVFNAQGEQLEPYDLLWKAMFPEWNTLTAINIDGHQAQVMLARNAQPDLARLWLLKGDPSQGYPAHLIALEGRDRAGELRTRYVYLQWSRMQRQFRAVSMFPNPFTVTGGEEDIDWRYEEDSRTLRVLTGQVSALSGGTGTDANDKPFSGRLALADGIGLVELTLDGVACKVPSGRACSLGRGNNVTLLLKRGTKNLFESGAGCAGISLGDGTSLCIDQPKAPGQPDGSLTAKGGTASLGIGRDSGLGQGQTASIMIRGGQVTAIEGKRVASGKAAAKSTLAGLRVSARALRLDAMDISTKEAAQDAVKQLSAGRRWVNRLQEAYRAVYGKLEQSLSGLGSIRQYARVVRDEDEVDALLWDMRQELLQSPMGVYGQWGLEDVTQLLDAMEGRK